MPDPTGPTEQQPERLRLMAVHAHPDDESSKGAATMARYVAEGVDVVVVTCTGGERGSILNPAMDRPEVLADLPAIRRGEMDRAREILGIRQDWLGYVDSGLPEDWKPWEPLPEDSFGVMDPEVSAERLVEWVRRERPHVMLTYDEQGGYPHPDHIRTHEISMIAFEAAGDPSRYPDAGEPWQPLKLYYFETFHKARLTALHTAMEQAGLESHYKEWLDRWEDRPEDEGKITTRVECGEYFEVRDRALIAHATQIDPESWWFRCPLEIQRAAWPTEDYQLARNLTSSTVPEDDLFAGVRESVAVGE
jgi:mycothiol S-conjugate amidase